MECSEPGAICPEELVAYLAGEHVRPTVVRASCALWRVLVSVGDLPAHRTQADQ